MIDRDTIKAQLPYTLHSIEIPALGEKIPGKVRESYVVGDKRVLITTDRLSAFDVILTTIPFKGQVLTELANHWFKLTEEIIPNHIIDTPHPQVVISREVEIVPIEVVVRGYIAGSAWRDYEAGKPVSGVTLPKGLRKSQAFEKPILTPSTKAEIGEHDEPISSEEILSRGIVEEALWNEISTKAIELFLFGQKKAREQGLILVDTKYEFGLLKKQGSTPTLVLADEVHTQDSSRYWLAESYEERFQKGEDPEMLDKEFVRRRLIEQGWMGEGAPPDIGDDFRVDIAERYIEAYEKITGQAFTPQCGPVEEAIIKSLAHISELP